LSQKQFYYVTLPDPDRKTFAFEFDRSDKAGKLLAMILLKGGQGNRYFFINLSSYMNQRGVILFLAILNQMGMKLF
jgi:hypothetical protein